MGTKECTQEERLLENLFSVYEGLVSLGWKKPDFTDEEFLLNDKEFTLKIISLEHTNIFTGYRSAYGRYWCFTKPGEAAQPVTPIFVKQVTKKKP